MLEPSPAVTLHWTDGVATVAVRGELDSLSSAQARERIASVADHGPQSLVLDLVGVGDRFAAESLALIAVARHLLPSGCVLDVRSGSPAVRQILRLAESSGPESRTGSRPPVDGVAHRSGRLADPHEPRLDPGHVHPAPEGHVAERD